MEGGMSVEVWLDGWHEDCLGQLRDTGGAAR